MVVLSIAIRWSTYFPMIRERNDRKYDAICCCVYVRMNRTIRWNKAMDTKRRTFHITILQQQAEMRSVRQLLVGLSLLQSQKERQMLQDFVPILSRCIERQTRVWV